MAELGMFPICFIRVVFDTFDSLDFNHVSLAGFPLSNTHLYFRNCSLFYFYISFFTAVQGELIVILLPSNVKSQHPLYHRDSFLLQLLANGVAYFFGIRHQYARGGNDAVKDQLCRNPTGYADSEGHRRVPAWRAICLEC